MKYNYTIQCVCPETQETGCFIQETESKKTISPVFSDLLGLFKWMNAGSWIDYDKSGNRHCPLACYPVELAPKHQ